MNDSKRTILEMLEQGKISQEQASQLLAALEDGEGPETEAESPVENIEPVVTLNDVDGSAKIYPDGTIELEDENGESAVILPKKSGQKPITLTLHPEAGNVVVDVPAGDEGSLSQEGPAPLKDAGQLLQAPPVPPVRPAPPAIPVMPAVPAPPAMPAMPAMPAIPARPASQDPEVLARYQEEVEAIQERYQEELEEVQERCQELLEEYQERVEEINAGYEEAMEQYQETLDQQNEAYQEQLDQYQEELEQYREQAEENRRTAEKAARANRQGGSGASPQNPGFWPLTQAEYNTIYNNAYHEVYNPAYAKLYEKFGPGSEGFDDEVQRIASQAQQAAEDAVKRAQAEKQRGPSRNTGSWGAWLNSVGREISQAMNGIGAEIGIDLSEAMEDVSVAVGDLKDSLREMVDDWREQKEEERNQDGGMDFGGGFPFENHNGEEGWDSGTHGQFVQVECQDAGPEDGKYVYRAHIDMDAVEQLEISWLSGPVELAPWEEEYVELAEFCHKPLESPQRMGVQVKDASKLTVNFSENGRNSWHGRQAGEKRLVVRIPAKLAGSIERLKVNSVSGAIHALGLSGERFDLSSVSGTVYAQGLHGENIELHTVSGNVKAQGISAEKLQVHAVSGTVVTEGISAEVAKLGTVSGVLNAHANAERFKVNTTSGRASLTVDQCPETAKFSSVSGELAFYIPDNTGFTAEYNSTSGEFHSDFPVAIQQDGKRKRSGRAVYGDGGITIKMNTTSGGMSVRKVEN